MEFIVRHSNLSDLINKCADCCALFNHKCLRSNTIQNAFTLR